MTAHGNNKEPEYLELCVDNEIAHVVLDNEGELAQLNEIARRWPRAAGDDPGQAGCRRPHA